MVDATVEELTEVWERAIPDCWVTEVGPRSFADRTVSAPAQGDRCARDASPSLDQVLKDQLAESTFSRRRSRSRRARKPSADTSSHLPPFPPRTRRGIRHRRPVCWRKSPSGSSSVMSKCRLRHLRFRLHHRPTTTTTTASASTTTTGPALPRAARDRPAARTGAGANPQGTLLCRAHPARSLEAGRPRDPPEPEARRSPAPRLPGQPGGRPALTENDKRSKEGRQSAPLLISSALLKGWGEGFEPLKAEPTGLQPVPLATREPPVERPTSGAPLDLPSWSAGCPRWLARPQPAPDGKPPRGIASGGASVSSGWTGPRLPADGRAAAG